MTRVEILGACTCRCIFNLHVMCEKYVHVYTSKCKFPYLAHL